MSTTEMSVASDKISLSTRDMSKEDRKMLRGIFLHSFNVFTIYSGGARAGASGFMWSIWPAIERFYKTKEERVDALKRHSTWYNITSNVGTFCMGLVASMEKENAEREDFDTHAIDSVKASLMGPMSGIGDAIFWGVLRVIAASVGMALCAENGSIMGPIVFFLIYNIPSWLTRWYMTVLGYRVGSSFITKVYESGLMGVLAKLASTLGLLMIGAMAASFVKFNMILGIPMPEGDPMLIQSQLDMIFKGLVPLLYTFGCFSLLRKNVNVNVIIIGTMVIGLALGLLGIC